MEADSIDAVVTDPPYELGFMGKRWDRAGVAFDPATWAAFYRVLKPGGRLLAFGAPRTSHRIWCAIEDAGFVLEDTVMWMFGSGFPKHKSKLKPAYEPVCVARKEHVTPLNIDACRIGVTKDVPASPCRTDSAKYGRGSSLTTGDTEGFDPNVGRWPANVILSHHEECNGDCHPDCPVRLLDEQSGEAGASAPSSGPTHRGYNKSGSMAGHRNGMGDRAPAFHADSGGASRFYYVAKASRSERNTGLEGMPERNGGSTAKGFTDDVAKGLDRNRPVANNHPTVKPVDLMRYLVRLVTPGGGTVLDPFCGSGSTGVACVMEARNFIGIEMSPDYAAIAERRIAQTQPSLFSHTLTREEG